jgi:hypothetical protein
MDPSFESSSLPQTAEADKGLPLLPGKLKIDLFDRKPTYDRQSKINC